MGWGGWGKEGKKSDKDKGLCAPCSEVLGHCTGIWHSAKSLLASSISHISKRLVQALALAFLIPFLLMHTLGASRLWLKYLDLHHPHGRQDSFWFPALARPSPAHSRHLKNEQVHEFSLTVFFLFLLHSLSPSSLSPSLSPLSSLLFYK